MGKSGEARIIDPIDDIMKNYDKNSVLSQDEIEKLVFAYHEGDKEAKITLLSANLGLITSVIKRFYCLLKRLEASDLFIAGYLSLSRVVDSYDPKKSAFSTYAIPLITQDIVKVIRQENNIIPRKDKVHQDRAKYFKAVNKYVAEHLSEPSVDEIANMTGLSTDRINFIITDYANQDTTSLNQIIANSHTDGIELGSILSQKKNDYAEVLNQMQDQYIYILCKKVLSPKEYYALYYGILISETKKLREMACEFLVTEEYIRVKLKRAKEHIKPYLESKELQIQIFAKDNAERNNLDIYRKTPIEPNNICLYLYIKEDLTLLERNVLYFHFFGEYRETDQLILKFFPFLGSKYYTILQTVIMKIRDKCKNISEYDKFKTDLLKEYKTEIYQLVEDEVPQLEYDKVFYNESVSFFRNNASFFSLEEQKLIKDHLGISIKREKKIDQIERKIQFLKYGPKYVDIVLPYEVLWQTYQDHKDQFTLYQQKNLEASFAEGKIIADLLMRLEEIYYHVPKITTLSLSKEEYQKARIDFQDKISPEHKEILDMYYGIGTEKKTIAELASYYQISNDLMRAKLLNRREAVKNLYVTGGKRISCDAKIYRKYILDPQYRLSNETREVLQDFVLNKKSYEEIATKRGTNVTRVSNIVTDGIRTLDFYRFYMKKIENDDSFDKLNDVVITPFDCEKEIFTHPSESLLDEEHKIFLSYYMGISCNYNPDGHRLNKKEMMTKLSLSDSEYDLYLYNCQTLLKAKKAFNKRPDHVYIPRNELETILCDPHLPLSEKEKTTIYSLFGLNGYPYKTAKELSIETGESVGNINRRYQRAILTIYKYQAGEIEGKLDYETDIVPIEKYFGKYDRRILKALFKDKKTCSVLEKEEGLTKDQALSLRQKLLNRVYDLLNFPDIEKFDFDFYEEAISYVDVPCYGGLSLMKQIFDLLSGMSGKRPLGIKHIIVQLNLDINCNSLSNAISDFMIKICKLKELVTKNEIFSFAHATLDDIKQLIIKCQDEMNKDLGEQLQTIYEIRRSVEFAKVQKNQMYYIMEKIHSIKMESENQKRTLKQNA